MNINFRLIAVDRPFAIPETTLSALVQMLNGENSHSILQDALHYVAPFPYYC